MKKLLFILIIGVCANTIAQETALDYFPFTEGTKYIYESEARNDDGTPVNTLSFECTLRQGDTALMIITDPWKTATTSIYHFERETVRLVPAVSRPENAWKKQGNIRFKLPPEGGTANWVSFGRTIFSEYLEEVITPQKAYRNCVKVVAVADREELHESSHMYFAKGIGLIRIEEYDKDNQLNPAMTFNLSRVL